MGYFFAVFSILLDFRVFFLLSTSPTGMNEETVVRALHYEAHMIDKSLKVHVVTSVLTENTHRYGENKAVYAKKTG